MGLTWGEAQAKAWDRSAWRSFVAAYVPDGMKRRSECVISSPFYGGPTKFQCFLSYKLSSSTIIFARRDNREGALSKKLKGELAFTQTAVISRELSIKYVA